MGICFGVDLGGTKVSIGLVENWKLIEEVERFFVAECKDADDLVNAMVEAMERLLKKKGLTWEDIEKIGIGSPGPLDQVTGTILKTPNLVILQDFPLGPKVQDLTGVETLVDNDANCFTLGEQRAGQAKGMDYVLGVTLGTGFGLGFVYKGEIYRGATGTAMEYALSPYKEGVFEDYISGRGLSKIYKEIHGDYLSPTQIYTLAQRKDPAALDTWYEFGKHLGKALTYLVNVLDPEIIVMGGSVSKGYDFFYDSMKRELFKNIHDKPRKSLKLARSSLGEVAGIIGSASLNSLT